MKIAPGKGKFSFKSYHGTYLVAEWPSGKMNANRRVADLWETFSVIPIQPDPIANTEGNLKRNTYSYRSCFSYIRVRWLAELNKVRIKIRPVLKTVF